MALLILLVAIPAHAQLRTTEITVSDAITTLQGQVERLQRQVGAMQTQLANQLCFAKSAYGYTLTAPGTLSIDADAITMHTGGSLAIAAASANLQSSGTLEMKASATMTIRGALLTLDGGNVILNGGSQRALSYESVAPNVTWGGTGTTIPILLRPAQGTVLIP